MMQPDRPTPATASGAVVNTQIPPAPPTPTVEVPNPALPATTTHQEDITTAGQRRINLIWEFTQATIAALVVLANMIVGTATGLGLTPSHEYPVILSSSLFLIVGFYFSRTNHAAIGGVGPKTTDQYLGR